MRKLYLSSIALIVFAFSGIVFQLSCSEEAISANGGDYILPPATTNSLGGVIVGSGLAVESNGTLSVVPTTNDGLVQKNLILYVRNIKEDDSYEYWVANIDGTNKRKIDITLSANLSLRSDAQLSPDGTKVIFNVFNNTTAHDDIYTVAIAGGVPSKIIDGDSDSRLSVQGVH